MKFLFLVLLFGMLQPAIATEALNDQELEALEKIKAIVEGRLRYKKINLDRFQDESSLIQPILYHVNSAGLKLTAVQCVNAAADLDLKLTLFQYLNEVTEKEIKFLENTYKIIQLCLTPQENILQCLTFLKMNIFITHMHFIDCLPNRLAVEDPLDPFPSESSFFQIMLSSAEEAFRAPSGYKEVVKTISFSSGVLSISRPHDAFTLLTEKANGVNARLKHIDQSKISFLHELSGWQEKIDATILCREQIHCDPSSDLIIQLRDYTYQKKIFDEYFWPITQVRTRIIECVSEGDILITKLAELLQKDFHGGDGDFEKALSKKKLKRLNKAKGKVVGRAKPGATEATLEERLKASSWKPVRLPPSDASSHSIAAPAGGASSSEITYLKREAGKPAASSVSRLATSSSCSPATTTSSRSDAVDKIKLRRLDFRDALDIFRNDFGATIEEGQIYTISLRGPNGGLTHIYCHNSHGAQDEKKWPAWRINMKEGLRAAGFEW